MLSSAPASNDVGWCIIELLESDEDTVTFASSHQESVVCSWDLDSLCSTSDADQASDIENISSLLSSERSGVDNFAGSDEEVEVLSWWEQQHAAHDFTIAGRSRKQTTDSALGIVCSNARRCQSKPKPRPSRVAAALLRARVPSNDELCLGNAFLTGCRLDLAVTREPSIEKQFEIVRRDFFDKHRVAIEAAGLGALLASPVQHAVKERFLLALRPYGNDALALCYHGTPEHHLPSIFEHGLLIAGKGRSVKVLNGAAYGQGIYVAKEGNQGLSQSYLRGNSQMLVCAVIDSINVCPRRSDDSNSKIGAAKAEGSEDVVFSAGARHRCSRYICRGGNLRAHRRHQKPAKSGSSALAAGTKTTEGARPNFGETLHNHSSFMVVKDEAHVVPLFIADRSKEAMQGYSDELLAEDIIGLGPSTGYNDVQLFRRVNNRVGALPRAGRRQVIDDKTGGIIWLSSAVNSDGRSRRAKRCFAQKLRTSERNALRSMKVEELNVLAD